MFSHGTRSLLNHYKTFDDEQILKLKRLLKTCKQAVPMAENGHFCNSNKILKVTQWQSNNFCYSIHSFFPLKGFLKKVTQWQSNTSVVQSYSFLQITTILLYDQKMFSCLRISCQSTSWHWMKQIVTTWNKSLFDYFTKIFTVYLFKANWKHPSKSHQDLLKINNVMTMQKFTRSQSSRKNPWLVLKTKE